MNEQVNITTWPALLTLEMACRYLSLEKRIFLLLAKKWNIYPVEMLGEAVLWRTKDLDALLRRLPADTPPVDRPEAPMIRLDRDTIDQIVQALAARLETTSLSARHNPAQLISIKDAGAQLGLSRSKIYTMTQEGALQIRRLGRRTLVTRESIQALLNE